MVAVPEIFCCVFFACVLAGVVLGCVCERAVVLARRELQAAAWACAHHPLLDPPAELVGRVDW
jgi:hypothetical protein